METHETAEVKNNRINYWDNYKGILIFLVVLGHFFYEFRSNKIIYFFALFIYLFHMPAFVFTSGYFCKENINFSRIKKYLFFYIIGNTFLMWFSFLFKGNEINLLVPYYSFWYLLALIVWRCSINSLKNINGILPISIIIALLVGFFLQIDNTLALSRIICFFPFFLLGVKAKDKVVFNLIIEKKNNLLIKIVIFIIACILSLISVFFCKTSFNDLQMFPYIETFDVIRRIMIYITAFFIIVVLMSITSNKKQIFFSKIGKNSLYIFFYHRIFTIVISDLFYFINSTLLIFCISFICSIIICIIFGSDVIRNATEKVYNKLLNMKNDKNLNLVIIFLKTVSIFILIVTLCSPLYNKLISNNKYMIDFIHPNSDSGIELYSRAVQE